MSILGADRYYAAIEQAQLIQVIGKVLKVVGLVIEAQVQGVSIGELCAIDHPSDGSLLAEVVGFREKQVLLMPLTTTKGIRPGARIFATGTPIQAGVGPALLGRVLDGLGNPIDAKGPLDVDGYYPIDQDPPNPLDRPRITDRMAMGVRAIDGLLTVGKGQRIGIFSGSGVGKSTLMGMLARNCESDINVIALIGERGREVKDFIEESLGDEGLKRSVVIAATSDQAPLIRLKGALLGTSIAEYFRDQGKNVLFMMDSVTRFAMAQREIGLATGEPPTTKGYTPSVFAMLPRLMERAGMAKTGSITGIYTVLVEGDDTDEPIADSARSILDGHIVLSRAIAAKNHYPCIDINMSISRLFSNLSDQNHAALAGKLREILAQYNEAEDLINIGAYVNGSNPKIDEAIDKIERINQFLKQGTQESIAFEDTLQQLRAIV
ncbi:flagellar protein export ATPase FliI [Candidatus Marinamargulisbacteria bacterium]|nr:flagellar protein export ATPase FliI [bacterium]MDA7563912.1 flagellar protein export ATPase FliI [Candidatus Marinamargulisbacteria bacterium]MDG2265080.1 flagellar protein export ATPase FliI [Candidatus Marinamargulisbacteria bacterium]